MFPLRAKKWDKIYDFLAGMGKLADFSVFPDRILGLLRVLIPFDAANYFIYSEDWAELESGDEASVANLATLDVPEQATAAYIDYYHRIDPIMADYFNTRSPLKSSDIIHNRRWEQSEYYFDFLRPNSFYYLLGTDLHYGERIMGTVTLLRSRNGPDFSNEELFSLELLRPHIAEQMYRLLAASHRLVDREANEDSGAEEESERRLLRFRLDYNLSPRESEVLELIVRGFTNRKISEALFISENTVKKHVYNIFQKTGAENRTVLAAELVGRG